MNIVEQNVTLIDSMGSDLSVVDAARVSFNKRSELEEFTYDEIVEGQHSVFTEYRLSEKDQKLIAYLAKHNHWTPFAHAFLSFRIKAPIFVARQLVKHQVGLAWNEVSRRYVDDEPEFWYPKVWRKRAENAKQGSSEEAIDIRDLYDPHFDEPIAWPDGVMTAAVECYNILLKGGVAPEQARMILPQNMMTEWIWSGSLAAFARVCKLRLDPHAQKETQDIAQMIDKQVPDKFEHSWKALLA